jgi:hypothetical protein
MKRYPFVIILFTIVANTLHAQVKIGGAAEIPHASAVLELDGGNNRGLLLPRMRKMDIDAIQNPAEGLTIYATDEQAVYLRKSLVWEKQAPFSLPYSGSIQLPTSAFDIFNMYDQKSGHAIYGYAKAGTGLYGNTFNGYAVSGHALNIAGIGGMFTHNNGGAALVSNGKTGIGTSEPAALLHIDGNLDYPGNTIIIDDDDDPTIQFRKVGINKSYIRQEGNNLVFRPNADNSSGKVVLQSYNDGGWMFLDAAGDVSLGINPTGFSGTPLGSRMNIRDNAGINLTLDAPADNLVGPSLNFVNKIGNNTTVLSKIKANNLGLEITNPGVMTLINGGNTIWQRIGGLSNILELKSYYGWPTGDYADLHLRGRMAIGLDFANGGNSKPQAALDIGISSDLNPSGDDEAIRINGDNPIIRINSGNAEKAFLQLVENDFKIGTAAPNDPGRFIVRTNGSDRLWVDSAGYVTIGGRIGPTISGPYKLAVKGKIAATDFNVVATGSWPDYVFDPSYKLRSLEETEAYIKENKHLPNIPAAAVVEKEGFALGDMQKRMLEKIEELTLHLIEANKALKEFRSSSAREMEQLKQQVQALQAKK